MDQETQIGQQQKPVNKCICKYILVVKSHPIICVVDFLCASALLQFETMNFMTDKYMSGSSLEEHFLE